MDVNNRYLRSLVVLLILAAAVFFGLQQVSAPDVLPKDASPQEFSAERAREHVAVVAEQPHPTGSQAAYEVRDYLINELKALGLNPEVQEGTGARIAHDRIWSGSVQNVIARLEGTEEGGKAIMIAAHYDSVPTAPGASDDGAAVGAMLETLRALKEGPPLKHDVIFLFTDGEELGLIGADVFTQKHPWVKDVGVVLNFEARGYTGPSFMFETSDKNGWLMKQFAEAAEHPVANSMLYDMYKLLPNDTDLTVFKQAELSGLNFAYAIGLNAYHNRIDTVETMDPKSLQHHGSYMLSLTKHLGNLDTLEDTQEQNQVYFNLFKHVLVNYSQAWVLPLTAVVTALFLFVLITGLRRRQLGAGGLFKGFLFFLLAIAATGGVATGAWMLIGSVQSDLMFNLLNDPDFSNVYAWGFALLSVAVFSALYAWFRRFATVANLTGGAMIWFWLFMLAASFLLPGGSYLFTWPLFFSTIGWHLLMNFRDGKITTMSQSALLALLAVPAVLLFVPIVYLVQVLVSLQLAGVIFALLGIMLGLLIPQLVTLADIRPWRFPTAMITGALAIFLISSFTQGITEQNPTLVNVFYGQNDNTDDAVYATASKSSDPWLDQYFSEEEATGSLEEVLGPIFDNRYRYADAPQTQEEAPELEILSDETSGDVRTVTFKLQSQREAREFWITAESEGKIISGKVFDREFDMKEMSSPDADFFMQYGGAPEKGIELTFSVQPAAKVKLAVVETKYGDPSLAGQTFTEAPKTIMANKRVMISKEYNL